MRAALIYGPGDIRVEEREDPRITAPTDALLSLTHSCICGSDLWPWRGIDDFRAVLETNVFGVFYCCDDAIPIM